MEDDSSTPPKIQIKASPEFPNSVTFIIHDEDHTLGNALRYILTKNPKVTFTGYSIPHPSDPILNLRVQTIEGYDPTTALREALRNLKLVCQEIQNTFAAETTNYELDT